MVYVHQIHDTWLCSELCTLVTADIWETILQDFLGGLRGHALSFPREWFSQAKIYTCLEFTIKVGKDQDLSLPKWILYTYI